MVHIIFAIICHYLYNLNRVYDGPSIFIYLFAMNTKTITINMHHITIAKSIEIIAVIKVDDRATKNSHRTVYLLYHQCKLGRPNYI